MAESLRDAIAAAVKCRCWSGCSDVRKGESAESLAACAEAAALKWFADWLRSDEAETAAAAQVDADYGSLYRPLGVARSALSALADALTKENPDGP